MKERSYKGVTHETEEFISPICLVLKSPDSTDLF